MTLDPSFTDRNRASTERIRSLSPLTICFCPFGPPSLPPRLCASPSKARRCWTSGWLAFPPRCWMICTGQVPAGLSEACTGTRIWMKLKRGENWTADR